MEPGLPDGGGLTSESCVDNGKLYRAVQEIKAVLESSRAELNRGQRTPTWIMVWKTLVWEQRW